MKKVEEDLIVNKPKFTVCQGIFVGDLPHLLVAPMRGRALKQKEILISCSIAPRTPAQSSSSSTLHLPNSGPDTFLWPPIH